MRGLYRGCALNYARGLSDRWYPRLRPLYYMVLHALGSVAMAAAMALWYDYDKPSHYTIHRQGVRICMYTCMYMHMCMCMCVCVCEYVYVYMHVNLCVYVYAYVSASACLHVYRFAPGFRDSKAKDEAPRLIMEYAFKSCWGSSSVI